MPGVWSPDSDSPGPGHWSLYLTKNQHLKSKPTLHNLISNSDKTKSLLAAAHILFTFFTLMNKMFESVVMGETIPHHVAEENFH